MWTNFSLRQQDLYLAIYFICNQFAITICRMQLLLIVIAFNVEARAFNSASMFV